MKNMQDLSFYSCEQPLDVPIVIVNGAARSGKTLVGKILGSCKNTEYLDEPWLPMVLAMSAGLGLVSRRLAVPMLRVYVNEMLNDRILMRHANFRPSDLTSIWSQKDPEEIFTRLIRLKTRKDVREYKRDKKTTLVINLTDTLPYQDLLKEAFPGSRTVHVVHEGLLVASETLRKRWYSDEELKKPTLAQLYRPYGIGRAKKYLYFWVKEGEEKYYLSLSEYARGLYYWRQFMEASLGHIARANKDIYSLRLPDFLRSPKTELARLARWLRLESTEQTANLIANLSYRPPVVTRAALSGVPRRELESCLGIYKRLGLATDIFKNLLEDGVTA